MRAFPALPGPACQWLGRPGSRGFLCDDRGRLLWAPTCIATSSWFKGCLWESAGRGQCCPAPWMAAGEERPSLPCGGGPGALGSELAGASPAEQGPRWPLA